MNTSLHLYMLVQATYYVYIVGNKNNTVIYIGVTNSLERRMHEHKTQKNKQAFSSRYNCDKLLYFESYENIENAIAREKILKKWNRKWKEELIQKSNPEWIDLSQDWVFE